MIAYILGLADDALILAQRLGEWVSRAPELEEDIALANIGLDLLGQARALYSYAGTVEGAGRAEDDFAYLREEREFRNCLLVEQRNGDFADTIARQVLFSAYQFELYQALSASTDATLAAVAAKAVKEVAYHVDHAAGWAIRLGDGTDESHTRLRRALDRMWPFTAELFEPAPDAPVDPAGLRPGWDATIDTVLAQAALTRPDVPAHPGGGRDGRHTEHFGYLLAELQYLHRVHPGATW